METARKPKVLVVDDEKAIVAVVRDVLVDSGYDAIVAYDGSEAISRAEQEQPDLIMLDVIMPHLSGFAVCSQLKSSPTTKHIPIVMLTGLDFVEAAQKSVEVGATAFLTKPIELRVLLDTVRAVLNYTEHPS